MFVETTSAAPISSAGAARTRPWSKYAAPTDLDSRRNVNTTNMSPARGC